MMKKDMGCKLVSSIEYIVLSQERKRKEKFKIVRKEEVRNQEKKDSIKLISWLVKKGKENKKNAMINSIE